MPIDDSGRAGGWAERTPADLASLMVELGRVAKAVPFYGPDSKAARSLVERACRALRADLARGGPLELEIVDGGFAVNGVPGSFGSEHLAGPLRGLEAAAVQRIRFTEVVSADSLMAFVETLERIDVDGRPPSQLGIELDGELCVMLASQGDDASDILSAKTAEIPLSSSLGSSLLGDGAPIARMERDEEKPDIHDEPLAAPAETPDGERLLASLRELDRSATDDRYIQLAANVADQARALCDDGVLDEAARAMFVLAEHSLGDGGRSAVQARVARATLLELAIGDRLGDLIDRACSQDTKTSVRAAQVLVTVGEQAVPALIERLGVESGDVEPGRVAQLSGLLIALGESAVPTLTGAIASGTGPRARLGIRIAGELQCPALAKPLRDLLCAKDGPLQREAARALVEMGNSAALRALLDALESKHERTAEIAAFALGTLGAPRSRAALVRRLERAAQDRSWDLAREILQSLGQFQTGDRATARALLAWVQRGGPPWRRPDLDLKLEAVTTLGLLSGPETTEALREISGLRLSPRLCERASRILDRRGDGRLTPRTPES